MDDTEYTKLFNAFLPVATARMNELAALMRTRFGHEITPVEPVDHDVERGLLCQLTDEPHRFVELVLTDGQERGFDGVGLDMSCSVRSSGQVWSPFNFTSKVGTRDVGELESRLLAMDLSSIAELIQQEWLELDIEAAIEKEVSV